MTRRYCYLLPHNFYRCGIKGAYLTTNYLLLSPYFLALLVSIGVTIYVFVHRRAKGAFIFLIFSLSETIDVAGFLLETLSPKLPQKIFWDNVQWLPLIIIPSAYLIFIYVIVGFRKREIQKAVVWISIAPILMLVLVVLDPWLKLIRPSAELLTENGITSLYYPFTPTIYLYAIYAYVLSIYSIIILMRQLQSATAFAFRAQLAVLLSSQLIVILGSTLVVFEILPKYLRDVNPLSIGLANLILAVGIYRTRLFDVVPIAKELVIETMETAIIVLDLQDCVVDINASALRILNRPDQKVIRFPVKEVLVDYPQLFKRYIDQEITEDIINVEYKGRRNYFDLRIVPICDRRGEIVGRLISLSNITSRIDLENQLQEQTAQLQETNAKLQREKELIEKASSEVAALRRLSEYMQASITVDEACNIISVHMNSLFTGTHGGLYLINDGFADLTLMTTWGNFSGESIVQPNDCWGMRRGRIFVRHPSDTSPTCIHYAKQPLSESMCLPLLAQGETIGMICLQVVSQDNRIFTEDVQNLAVASADSIALALANLRLRERLHNESIRDPLTGLFNRRYLEETLARETHRASRSQNPLCVIMFEVDDFKRYNNTFGHDAGDYVLRKVADTMKANLRPSDFPCRYGGDEFTLLLPETTLEDGATRAEDLRKEVQALTLSFNTQALGQVTVRMGVASYPKHGDTGEAVLRIADDASYRAREIGKNCVVVAE
jgi:diguanylate cyclase (GGDEF)-like protein